VGTVVDIAVEARRGQLAVRTPDADDDPGLPRAPSRDVELQGARTPIVDEREVSSGTPPLENSRS
jgi:hypothetical protein